MSYRCLHSLALSTTYSVKMKGIIVVLVVELCRQSPLKSLSNLPAWTTPLAISSLCISLALNTIVTGLLVLRIAMLLMWSRRSRVQADRRLYDISPVISILIETGMVTFVSQLLLVVLLGLRSASATFIVGGSMIMIYVGSS